MAPTKDRLRLMQIEITGSEFRILCKHAELRPGYIFFDALNVGDIVMPIHSGYTGRLGTPGQNSLTAPVVHEPLRHIKKTLPLRVLSQRDFEFWQTYGFIVVKDAVPLGNVTRVVKFLWDFQGMDPDDPTTWSSGQTATYAMKEINNSGMVEAYNHQTLWDNRQCQRIYDAFVDIWDRVDLWVTIDRANLNTPNESVREFDGYIHTDVDTTLRPLPVMAQGVLCLADVHEDSGGFQCTPELFKEFDSWEASQSADRDGFAHDVGGFEIVSIPMRAGDLLIFNSLLPHGIKPNRSKDKVRIAQYISMTPADQDNDELRLRRIDSWLDREAPVGFPFPGDRRYLEERSQTAAELTPLGRKLVGLESWY
jgi:hypothetical protein